MLIKEIQKILDAQLLVGEELLETEVNNACGSDMMSDVLAFVKQQAVLLTGLVNPQVIRTAEMMDMKCVVFVRGKRPDRDMTELAENLDIILLTTKIPMFSSCGLLYEKGLGGGEAK